MIVILQDCIDCKYCRKGVRAFFIKYKLDYTNFLMNGIESDILIELNDSMATKVVENARGRK